MERDNTITQQVVARDLMSSPVRTISPETTIATADGILRRYGHSGLLVVAGNRLVGMISRRDIDVASHHGFSQVPVQGHMTTNLKTITPDTPLSEIQSLMVTTDSGRIPVVDGGELVGIITRTDILRQIHQAQSHASLLPSLSTRLASQWQLLTQAAAAAEKRGWHLYLVGGVVRDLLLAPTATVFVPDLDLVVDGHQTTDAGAGVELAKALQHIYPGGRLEIHGSFQTAALKWDSNSLAVDMATARTEFYLYPAANPEVEASSIRQDLYRRDFTVNALALRLTSPGAGELLDFFGGLQDLQAKQIRVIHANSFIEDPTRIYRAVRFAVRLGFKIEPQTEVYIRYATSSGVYDRTAKEHRKVPSLQIRLKAELKTILQATYWQDALELLGNLGALKCIHPTLELEEPLWRQLRLLQRCLRRDNSLIHWLLRLEVIIAHLAPKYRPQVAKNLQLPADSIVRLEKLATVESVAIASLSTCQPPSLVVQLLRQYDLPMLILIAVRSQRVVRHQIWHYLTVWTNVQPPLNGKDLQQLGYKRGAMFRQMLDELLDATLDGAIGNRAEAEAFLARNHPL